MICYNKLFDKLREKGITTYIIRKKGLIPQSTLTKFNMCSVNEKEREAFPGKSDPEIIMTKLEDYAIKHCGNEFKTDVSTKTIEDICQLLQCQPCDIMDWNVDLNVELAYENKQSE